MDFETAVKTVVQLTGAPTNEEKLKIYGLYKQSTVGDVNTPTPSFFDFAGNAKWKSWNEYKGKTQDQAKQEYTDFVTSLVTKYGVISA